MYKYFLKLRLRNKAFVFWCLVFPLALMTCFKIAFGNLTTDQSIDTKEIAVIYENEGSMYADGNGWLGCFFSDHSHRRGRTDAGSPAGWSH